MANKELHQYLTFVDQRFRKAAILELKRIFPDSELQLKKRFGGEVVLVTAIKENADEVTKILEEKTQIFTDLIIPLDLAIKRKENSYDEVLSHLSKILEANDQTFMIEVKVVNAELEDRAKSVEVLLGNRLEKEGFVADLMNPKILLYVVFFIDKIMLGHIETSPGVNNTLDRFRSTNKSTAEMLNRAEFKIKEAIDFFGIDIKKIKLALDIGAAPGGWTHYLSKHGVNVVAIDKGLLDYQKLIDFGRILILTGNEDVQALLTKMDSQDLKGKVTVDRIDTKGIDFGSYQIIHIKAHLKPCEQIEVLKKLGKFDLLMIDTNTSPEVSAGIANSLTDVLNDNAGLVMTTKLMTMLIDEHMKVVKDELSKHYCNIRIKKLPHNRRELTVYATLNSAA